MTRTARDIGIVLGTFIVVSAVAALLGAANMGTALTFGQIVFAAVLLWALLTR